MKNKSRKAMLLLTFGERVKQPRMEQNITQSQLAFEAELSREHISRIEHGKRNIGLETALGLCAGFGIELKELFDFEYEKWTE